jgi:hypothetical protein
MAQASALTRSWSSYQAWLVGGAATTSSKQSAPLVWKATHASDVALHLLALQVQLLGYESVAVFGDCFDEVTLLDPVRFPGGVV